MNESQVRKEAYENIWTAIHVTIEIDWCDAQAETTLIGQRTADVAFAQSMPFSRSLKKRWYALKWELNILF